MAFEEDGAELRARADIPLQVITASVIGFVFRRIFGKP
jgi:hypothetical protein